MIPVYIYVVVALVIALVFRRHFGFDREDTLLASIGWPAHAFLMCLLGAIGLLIAPVVVGSALVQWVRRGGLRREEE